MNRYAWILACVALTMAKPAAAQGFFDTSHWFDWKWQRGNLVAGAGVGLMLDMPWLHGSGGHCSDDKPRPLWKHLVIGEAVLVAHDVIHRYHIILLHPKQDDPGFPGLREIVVGYPAGLAAEYLGRRLFETVASKNPTRLNVTFSVRVGQ